jgi:uncharacterized protein (DUF983 family)
MFGEAARTPASKNGDSFPRTAGIEKSRRASQRICRRAGVTRSLTGPSPDVVFRGYDMTEQTITTLSGAIGAGLSCACPRCGRGRLFQGFLTLRPRCEHCGLDYAFADAGDGPAVFVMFLAGAIVVGAALITEILFHPPYWVHAALWLPLILVVTLGPLRPMKGLMIALQYHHQAAESRFGGEQS